VISRDALNQFGGTDPEPGKSEPPRAGFNMRGYLALHGFKVLREKPWASHPGGTIYELDQCLFNPDHTDGSAAFTEVYGMPGFTCKHDGCAGRTIKDIFAAYPPVPSEDGDVAARTQAQILIGLAGDAELFHTPGGEAYARYKVGTHFEIARIGRRSFRQWLIKRFFDVCKKPPGTQAFQEAAGVLEAKAQFEGLEIAVAVRVAEHGGRIYIDLCDKEWAVVEISPEGWKVVLDPPVRFRRTGGMRALPRPQPGGSLARLRKLINIGDEDNWILLVSWLVAACRPNRPFPILVLQGEQGSAKSTLERIIRMIIDPSSAPVRTPPRGDRDLLIAATNSWVVAYDNLSAIQQWLSDALCRLATGGGFSTRELYTDSEEAIFDAMRPVVLNGIDYLTERADLADRAVILNLPRIADQNRRTEQQVYEEFESELPQILGALYTAVSAALQRLPNTTVAGMPRMADFAFWATAAEQAMGLSAGEFMRAYQGNRVEAVQETLEGDAVAVAILAYMERREQDGQQSWQGNCKELKPHLDGLAEESVKKSDAWPKSPRALSGRLRRLATFLRESGIDIVFPPKGTKASHGKRVLTINRTASQTTATTATSASQSTDTAMAQSVTAEQYGGGSEHRVADEPRPGPRPPPASAEPGPLKANGKQPEVAKVAVVAVDRRALLGDTSSTAEDDQLYRCSKCGLVDWTWNGSAWVCPQCGAPAAGQRVRDADTERFEL
jgi:hypothetical protein